jgi:hypothetical protein
VPTTRARIFLKAVSRLVEASSKNSENLLSSVGMFIPLARSCISEHPLFALLAAVVPIGHDFPIPERDRSLGK